MDDAEPRLHGSDACRKAQANVNCLPDVRFPGHLIGQAARCTPRPGRDSSNSLEHCRELTQAPESAIQPDTANNGRR
jgi:hypothetical protein